MNYILGLFTGLFIAVIIGLLISLYNEAEKNKKDKIIKKEFSEIKKMLEEEEIEIL